MQNLFIRKKSVFFLINKSNKISKMDNAHFSYQMTVASNKVRFGLAYPVLSFQDWLASTNARSSPP